MTTVELDAAPADVPARALAWAQASDISARSALVTILGDTVAPLGGRLWLADLIALADPFGFSERLVRTSMFRLAAEGWVDNERVGRRSRYALTGYGLEEIASAEARIYRPRVRPWDGQWTLVFLADGSHGELARHLRWRGFAQLADGVHAAPNDEVAATRHLVDRLGVHPPPPVAAARFDDASPVAASPFRADSGLAEAEEGYRRFVEAHGWAAGVDLGGLAPVDAYVLRTMVVHDLRRVRLRDPELPAALLPGDWIGQRADELAATVYRSITDRAWRFVAEVTGLTTDPDRPPLSLRFTPASAPPDPAGPHPAEPQPATSEGGSP